MIWLGCIAFLLIWFLANPQAFTPEAIVEFISKNKGSMVLVYILISCCRGLFLIPSTPFVLAGVLLFPENPIMVVTISIIGVLMGSSALYYFSDALGFSEKLEKKYPEKLNRWHARLNSPKSTLIVIAWSFFPLVPTDLICYVAGIVKMPFKFMLLGVFIGEIILISLYVYLGNGIVELILG